MSCLDGQQQTVKGYVVTGSFLLLPFRIPHLLSVLGQAVTKAPPERLETTQRRDVDFDYGFAVCPPLTHEGRPRAVRALLREVLTYMDLGTAERR